MSFWFNTLLLINVRARVDTDWNSRVLSLQRARHSLFWSRIPLLFWLNPAIPHHSMLSPISRIYSHPPTAVLFFFSHVTIPKAAITPSCRNKFQWISVSYSAKDLTKERTTTNESLPVSLVSEPHDYNTRSASSNQIFIPSFRSNLRRFWPGSIIGCFFWKNIPKFTRDKAS